ncbi:juvenile hormone epoxide hydrolase-like isoform X2 [Ostrinia furnacalis]|uniref:juvenile hormone epoxide hydrolase-like isoform X1 n=1 Tax=Ostrinia furnacalis TaxID=93504 RepID=UPI00103E2EBF|nr:juvenile hormone epoxide hydrolase-like isoform X1 [Ostrinia furnacalis]XP_028170522.1 juvenile hormone epoxide hydrolase-like isoform X2 [Ostrinia furnacalis]
MVKAVFKVVLFLAVVFLPIYFLFLAPPPPLPELDHDAWWGPENLKAKQDTSIKTFKVKFDKVLVKDLQDRLKSRRPFPPPLQNVGFEYGFNTNTLETWLQYWAKDYNFAEREAFFNQYPHFKTNIQGLDIHFLRVTPQVPEGVQLVPLLLLHGWPGSVREFYEAIPLLTAVSKDRDFALELIIPSLPGYGYSSPAVRPGMGPSEIALIMKNLMHRLGFKKFYVQGGDWGSLIGSHMSTFFPEEVLGFHSNCIFLMSQKTSLITILGSIYPTLIMDEKYVDRHYPLSEYYSNLIEEMGYMHIQATKPDTVGIALLDSPSGLLAYILEKFSTWTRLDHRSKVDGGLEFRFTKDQLLDNLMMYYAPKSITTSMRLYSEYFNKRGMEMKMDEIPSPVPVWVVQARHELAYLPPWLIRFKFPNLVNATHLDDGGHFLAFETPTPFSEDVLNAITAFRKLQKKESKEEL